MWLVRSQAALGWALAVGVVLGGCARGGGGPATTLDQYGRALRDRDYGRAYDLMSDEFRRTTNKEQFIAIMRDNPDEVKLTAERLSGRRSPVAQVAEFEYGLDDRLRMVFEDGRWKVSTSPMAFYDQSTPRATLRSFVRAYRLQRWDVMLRFVPDAYRERMTADTLRSQFSGADSEDAQAMMSTLEGALDGEIIERGNEARMSYGEASEVTFVREDGLWKVRDPD